MDFQIINAAETDARMRLFNLEESAQEDEDKGPSPPQPESGCCTCVFYPIRLGNE